MPGAGTSAAQHARLLQDTDFLNLAQLYAMRTGQQFSNQFASQLTAGIQQGYVPDEIRPTFEMTVLERMGPQGRQGSSRPASNTQPTSPMPQPRPGAEPMPQMRPTDNDAAAAPGVRDDSNESSPIFPFFPAVANRDNANQRGDRNRGARTGADIPMESPDPATRGLEGEVLGPERNNPTAIEDGRNAQPASRRAGRDPNFRVTPNDPANGPRALPAPSEPSGRNAPRTAPQLSSPPMQLPPPADPMNMPIDDPFASSGPRIEIMPDANGQPRPVLEVILPRFGRILLTPEGEVLDASGKAFAGEVPFDLDQSIKGAGNAERSIYDMFNAARVRM